MACACEKVAGKDIDLSPTCIGHLWIFQNIEPAELEALSREALRKKSATGQALFIQGDPADEMFLIKGGGGNRGSVWVLFLTGVPVLRAK